ncbi:MAG: hypothetical protein ACK5ZJ_12930 [Acidobacteriota bacterium]|jgi:hypothetical protein
MTRFAPSKHFVYMAVIAVLLGLMCAYAGWRWTPAILPASLFFATALVLLWLSFRPVIELTDCELLIGKRSIPWSSITNIRTTRWLTPLLLHLIVDGGRSVTLIFAGDLESSGRLKDMIRQCAPHALLNGASQRKRQAVLAVRNGATSELERHPILTQQDEAEVERMFQRLREVGRLDGPNKDC